MADVIKFTQTDLEAKLGLVRILVDVDSLILGFWKFW